MTWDDETVGLLALLASERDSGWRRQAALSARVRESGSALEILGSERGLFVDDDLASAREQLDMWRAQHIDVVSMFDPRYPRALAKLREAPGILFLAGDARVLDPERSVSIVGSRQASATGRARAAALAASLADEGYIVTSGLAEGIDTAAHEAALQRGGMTAAVLGNGIQQVYPRQNAGLQRRIARHGVLVSQFWPDRPPARWTFPIRNALMAALTGATVIVEAGATSGTRVQARAALELGRLVVLLHAVLEHEWASDLVDRPGVVVAGSVRDVVSALRTPPLIRAA